jgi:hypothetical protein
VPKERPCTKRPYEERIQAARAARLIEVCAPKDREITPGPLDIYLCIDIMRLSELKWRKLVNSSICIDVAGGDSQVEVYRYNNNNNNTYSIYDYRVSPRRGWTRVDELTAECILIELMKPNPER